MARLHLELTTAPEELDRLTEAVEAYCRSEAVPDAAAQHLVLVLDELFTNVRSYGFPDGVPESGAPPVAVTIDRVGEALQAKVVDCGTPFNPLDAPPPDLSKSLEDRQLGGLGLYFLKRFMHDIRYERQGCFNRLDFTKPFASEDRDG